MRETDRRLIRLHPDDNVLVLGAVLRAGEAFALDGREARADATLGLGHKIAARAIAPGEKVLKYGAPIGSATAAIAPGAHVHLHNLASDYTASVALAEAAEEGA